MLINEDNKNDGGKVARHCTIIPYQFAVPFLTALQQIDFQARHH
jgi:hypothetical protein